MCHTSILLRECSEKITFLQPSNNFLTFLQITVNQEGANAK